MSETFTQERVYQNPITELKQRLIETWSGIQQSFTDQAIDQWRRDRLNAFVKANTKHHFEHFFDLLLRNLSRLLLGIRGYEQTGVSSVGKQPSGDEQFCSHFFANSFSYLLVKLCK